MPLDRVSLVLNVNEKRIIKFKLLSVSIGLTFKHEISNIGQATTGLAFLHGR